MVTAASAYALRGYFAPTDEFQAFAISTSQLNPIYSFSPGDNVSVQANNFTILYNSQSQNATAINNILFGSFSSLNTTAVVFQELTNINGTRYPYFEVSVTSVPDFTSTAGFGFGLRFLARLADGSVVQLSNDQLAIEHVPSGGTTTLRIYVPNYNLSVNSILGIRIYAEERAGINSEYSIRINSIIASSLNRVPYCSSPVCYIPLELPNSTGYVDTLAADTVFAGASDYNIVFSYGGQIFVSRAYSNGVSVVSITAHSLNASLQNTILASMPLLQPALYIISATSPSLVQVQSLKLTFTPVPVPAIDIAVSSQTNELLLFVELVLVFGLPGELIIFRRQWKFALVTGVIMRLLIIPWTGHPTDTLFYIRTAYLYYHEGWAPIFYNPPTIFALSVPIGSMQFYYMLGLDRIDPTFLFHYGGILATFFVKLPFLLCDVANAIILSRVSENKAYAMFYFLNPFSIYVSAVWGQYEGLTTLALIAGYVGIVRFRHTLATLTGLGGFTLASLVELFGFFAVLMLTVYLALKKRYLELALPVLATLLVLLIPSSLSRYVLSFGVSSPILQPGLYSFSGNFGIVSQLPLVTAVTASTSVALYSLIRTSSFFGTIAPFSAAIISFELLGGNHPQFMLIPLGLLTLLFATRNDIDGLVFVWICGAILAFISMVGTQSFAYLLTGQGYYMIPLIEGGQHLKFYAAGLLIVNVGLLTRVYWKLPLWLISSLIAALVGLGWFLVNFV